MNKKNVPFFDYPRLWKDDRDELISVIDEVGGSTTIGTFTMPGNTVEFVEKKSTEAIFAADASVLGSAVGYSIS